MRPVLRVLVALLLAAWAAAADIPSYVRTGVQPARRYVILISIDGWRWDYHTRIRVPTLRGLIERGVRAEGLIPSFPSKTFPNHYTVVTGLYPGHHGMVGNTVRDPRTGRIFSMTNRAEVQDPMWWGGEPVWVTLQRAGGRAAAMFWPGSEAPIHGVRPTFWNTYDHMRPNDERVDQVLGWLDLPAEKRPSFLTLYFSDVDGAGHTYGPESTELARAAERVDGALARLVRGLSRRELSDTVNVVIVSDHGMAETSRQRVIFTDELFAPSDGQIVDINPTLGVWPREGAEERVYRKLVTAHPRLSVYRRSETPEHWHYRDHERIPPIVGVADEGWLVMQRRSVADYFARNIRGVGGNHGYDPRALSMRGLFVASGPAFREHVVVPAFENVHIYNALCEVLGIAPAPNDGDPEVARALLKETLRKR